MSAELQQFCSLIEVSVPTCSTNLLLFRFNYPGLLPVSKFKQMAGEDEIHKRKPINQKGSTNGSVGRSVENE